MFLSKPLMDNTHKRLVYMYVTLFTYRGGREKRSIRISGLAQKNCFLERFPESRRKFFCGFSVDTLLALT